MHFPLSFSWYYPLCPQNIRSILIVTGQASCYNEKDHSERGCSVGAGPGPPRAGGGKIPHISGGILSAQRWWSPRRWRPASGWPAALSATSWIITGTTPPAPAGSRSLRPPRPGGSRHSPPSRTVRRTEREGGAFCPALPLDRASSPWYNGQNHKGDCPGTWRQTF